jgi:uncharacterized paraquat-inducible protein A
MKNTPLEKLIICPECHTLHRKIKLKKEKAAYCSECEYLLYYRHKNLLDKGMALALATLITFVMASSFPIVRIEMSGIWHDLTLPFVFVTLFKEEFFVVGMIVSFLIFFVPLLYIVIYLVMNGREGFREHMLLGWAYILIPLGIAVVSFYFVSGQTPGLKAYDLKVIDVQTGEKPTLLSAILRFLFFNLTFFTFFGLFVPLFRGDMKWFLLSIIKSQSYILNLPFMSFIKYAIMEKLF